MNSLRSIINAERGRTLDYGAGIAVQETTPCPVCGSDSWDYLLKDRDGSLVGCDDCLRRIYS